MDSHYIQIDGNYCVLQPGPLHAAAQRLGLPTHWWGRANSVEGAVGMKPATARLLVTRGAIDIADRNIAHSVTWTWVHDGVTSSATLGPYYLNRAECIGIDGDSKAAYLCEFVDARALLAKCATVNRSYNVTVPLAPQDSALEAAYRDWEPATLNAGSPWTWQEMLADLWAELDAGLAGACPLLTWTPEHNPHNWRFWGWQAWDAIGEILEACHSTLLPIAGGFSVMALGGAQAGLAAALTGIAGRLLFDAKHKADLSTVHNPATVLVMFPRRGWDHYTIPPPEWWDWTTGHGVSVGTGLANSYGELVVWSDLPAEISDTGTILNAADVNASAAAIAAKVATRVDWLSDPIEARYSGLHSSPGLGTQIHRVVWRDYGDADGLCTDYSSDWGLRIPRHTLKAITELRPLPPGIYAALTPQGGIPARAALQVGSAVCDIYWIDTNDTLQPFLDENAVQVTLPVKNVTDTAIDGSIFIRIVQELPSGRLIAETVDSQSPADTSVVLLKAQACFGPGGSGTFDLYEWTGIAWADSGSDVTAFDEDYDVFLLPGEFVWAKSSSNARYDLIGDMGLARIGVCAEDIACDGSGSVEIHYRTGVACGTDSSQCTITACNDWGVTRNLKQYDEVHVRYTERAWSIIPTPRARNAIAYLQNEMCPEDEHGTPSSVTFIDACSAEAIREADNLFSLAGEAGDWIKLEHDQDGDRWIITQVQHHVRDIVVEEDETEKFLQMDPQGGCTIEGHVLEKAAIMSCGDQKWKDQITGASVTAVSSLTADQTEDGCPTISVKTTSFCALSAGAESDPSVILAGEEVLVVVGGYDDGVCAKLIFQAMCVLSFDQETAEADLICGVDCVTSSSGSSGPGDNDLQDEDGGVITDEDGATITDEAV